MNLRESETFRLLKETGLLTDAALESYERELSERDNAVGGYCPLDAERLRSMDAVSAYGVWLYILVRTTKPNVIVETGVQNGCSTEMLLWALHRNGAGRLYSIDSGSTSSDGSHSSPYHPTWEGIPGKDILDPLRAKWDLTIGLTGDCLPVLCRRVGKIDLFWHDSDHSSENVAREFRIAKSIVRVGGLMCMHDFAEQETSLTEPDFKLLLPQTQPQLRLWTKVQ